MEQRTPTPEPMIEAPAARFEPPPPPSRSPITSFGWALRDYAKRVWDNSGEDNVLFLAGGITFNIMLAAVPFVMLVAWGASYIFGWFPSSTNAPELVLEAIDRFLPIQQSTESAIHQTLQDLFNARGKIGIIGAVGF